MTTRRTEVLADPYSTDYLGLMRELERGARGKPRIGTSAVMSQDIVALGQDPYMEFPASNVTGIEEGERGRPMRVRTRFLGFFGPQGALPLSTTMEAFLWQQGNDASFVAFTDILTNRFLQLFFRAWSNARPITQHDRPEDDRFHDYVGSFIGIGTPAFHDRDAVPDITKLPFVGLMSGRVKSATRLRQMLEGVLGLDVDVVERVGSWLDFEPSDLSRLGRVGATLGQNTYLGARIFTVDCKARLRVRTRSLEEYESFLPGGKRFRELSDMIRLYLGDTVDFDVELALPRSCLPAVVLGKSGKLGWTAWSAPTKGRDDEFVYDAVFSTAQASQTIPANP